MSKKSTAPSSMPWPCDSKPAPMTQPDRSDQWSNLDTRQREQRYAAQDRLYAPPVTAPVVSMVPGAKNSWNK